MAIDYGKKQRLTYFAVFACGAVVLGFLFFNNAVACAILFAGAFPFERHYKKMLAERRRKQLSVEFKDLLLSLSSSFQTGRHMGEAIREARENLLLIYREDAPINVEVAQMVRRIEQGGESERDVLFDFATRSGSEDARNFADVYYTCLTTGGDIVKVVNRTAEVLIEKMAIRREIEMLMAQKQYEAKLLAGIPLLILAYLRFSSPDYIACLYDTVFGTMLMAGALAALAASVLWSSKIMEIEV
ncbi:MAG: type II secretion system F family protein [Clostridiales Family XIII bacterium]|jgi:tight adherence protein B|nr:type II secretion system F family protein [Clostridiales Family XIII bacterium]